MLNTVVTKITFQVVYFLEDNICRTCCSSLFNELERCIIISVTALNTNWAKFDLNFFPIEQTLSVSPKLVMKYLKRTLSAKCQFIMSDSSSKQVNLPFKNEKEKSCFSNTFSKMLHFQKWKSPSIKQICSKCLANVW